MKSLDEFKKFFETDLRKPLEVFERRRKKILLRILLMTVVVGAIVGILVVTVKALKDGAWIIPLIIGFIIISGVSWFMTRSYRREFKLGIVAPIVKFCDESLTYHPETGIGQAEYMSSLIFKQHVDRYKCEDLVTGRLGATQMKFSEVHSEYKTETTDSKGHHKTEWHTIFRGLFFIADFNKHFRGRTFVLPDTAQRLLGILGQSLQSLFKHDGELVKMEDPEFEKYFVVYGSDQVESRYVLSTSLMKRITDFRKKTRKGVYMSFIASNVYVAITMYRDLFEPRLFRTLMKFEVVQKYLEDLQFAAGIVDDLNLNTRIWTKS